MFPYQLVLRAWAMNGLLRFAVAEMSTKLLFPSLI